MKTWTNYALRIVSESVFPFYVNIRKKLSPHGLKL